MQPRKRIVPKGCVEVFEVRIVSYFNKAGEQWTAAHVLSPDGPVSRHEVIGTIHEGIDIVKEQYDKEQEE